MDKIITCNFTDDFISNLAGYIETNFIRKGIDLSRVAVVFGGKRPSLFLKKELSKRIKKGFFPPQFFSIDEFVKFIVSKKHNFRMPADLESSYIIYTSAKKLSSDILKGKEKFPEFLPWAGEIAGFIDELDLENILEVDLKKLETAAETGYEIPENINRTLENIVKLRDLYHDSLRSRGLLSRGLVYMDAAKLIGETDLKEFDKVLFCNFYYLHKTEKEILKHLLDSNKAILFFQKDSNPWLVFDELSKLFNHRIEPYLSPSAYYLSPKISIYKGFDNHSQVGLVREILNREIIEKGKSPDKTVVILPDSNNLIPLLSEISSSIEDFNVSMGYPLKRSALYGLLKFIFEAQSTRKENGYYAKDYLKVILHPLMKNLKVYPDPVVTRILVHKTEEIFLGIKETDLSGSLFLKLDDVENMDELYEESSKSIAGMDIKISPPEIKNILKEIHTLAFKIWENIADFSQFTACLEKFNQILLEKSFVENYPLNTKILERIYEIIDELKQAEFDKERFKKEDIFKIFDQKLKSEIISFKGSPLKGLQILGLFESRSLNFENVIIMDLNESILPKVQIYEPLIPRQITEGLGVKRLKQEEEIQRYHFMRLIGGAKNVYFVYNDNPEKEKEKSRFIEEIIWQRQKEQKTLEVFTEVQAKFNMAGVLSIKNTIKKDEKIIKYFKENFVYSSSSIDTYLNCPMKFYYQYVLRLREKEDLLNEPEAKDIGIFIHEFLDYTFRGFLGKKPVIDKNFEKDFLNEFEKRFLKNMGKRLGSEAFLVKHVMEHRLKKFLENEISRDVEKILSLEEDRPVEKIKLSKSSVGFKYRIDRIDQTGNGGILVVDYKTGSSAKSPNIKKIDKLEFNRKSIKDIIHSFQLPVYFYFVRERYKGLTVNAALYNLQDLNFTYFVKYDDIDKINHVMDTCLKALEFIVDEILDPKTDFCADDSNERNCEYCEFSGIC